MKKFLTIALASTLCAVAYANPTPAAAVAAPATAPAATSTAPAFDNTKMKCGEHTLGDKENVDTLTTECKGFQFGKGKAGFLDENSGKKVLCQEKKGILLISTCQAKN